MSYQRELSDQEDIQASIKGKYFQSLNVQSGPFEGLKYASFEAFGSTLYPKLVGSYEKELEPALKEMLNDSYSEVINIGCAEGYYAVGFALKNRTAKVYAYDIEDKARELCQEMAEINGVSDRVFIDGEFTPDSLSTFNFTKKGLILCDCEGYEKQLFTQETIKNLHNCDLIIEAHDYRDISISPYLKELFEKTHEIESVYSFDDIQKTHFYEFDLLQDASLEEKKIIFAESRPAIMEWLICRAKEK